MKRVACLLAIFGGLSFSAMGTELYKWVDENGVVHYSQMPPENTQTAEVEVPAVAAGRCEDVGDRGADLAVFGAVGDGVDLDVVDRFRRQLYGEVAGQRVGGARAVDEQHALAGARTIEVELAAGAANHARKPRQQLDEAVAGVR